jgi:predicted nucleotidyltransferase
VLTLERRFLKLLEILGEKSFDKAWEDFICFAEPWFLQLEQDLEYLTRFIETDKLISCFRNDLKVTKGKRNNLREIAYEVYTEAILASASEKIELHVPTPNAATPKNFDFRVIIKGCEINGDVKTRRDVFPFNLPSIDTPKVGVKIYRGTRATVDKHFLEDSDTKPNMDRETPGSTDLKQTLEKALAQLPCSGKNIIILGSITQSHSIDLKDALYGHYFTEVIAEDDGVGYRALGSRYPNGVFLDKEFARINAVIWIHLDHSNLKRTSYIFFNRNAAEPFPENVKDTLIQLFDRQKYLERELSLIKEKIIRDYSPEKIILFGSLARGGTHEWSDLDLAIIKKTDLPFIERSVEILRIIRPRVGINLFVYTPEEFYQLQQQGNFFIRDEVEKKGKVIYDSTNELV